MGWLAVLPFLRKLPHSEPELPPLDDPPPPQAYILDAVHPPHYVICCGDTRGLWGNGATDPGAVADLTNLLSVTYDADGRIADPNIWNTRS